jgi:hypothetical protein
MKLSKTSEKAMVLVLTNQINQIKRAAKLSKVIEMIESLIKKLI